MKKQGRKERVERRENKGGMHVANIILEVNCRTS